MYNSKLCLKREKGTSTHLSLAIFSCYFVREICGGWGVSKLSFVLILQLEELCIAELSPGKV